MTMKLPCVFLALLALGACTTPAMEEAMNARRQTAAAPDAEQDAPLALRVPIRGVMAGIIDFSAHGIFETATSEMPLSEEDWMAAGLASINLISSATLITSAGAGASDQAWIADPAWRRWAEAYQEAGVAAAVAIRGKNRAAFLAAANDIANACQSCHDLFRARDHRIERQLAAQIAPQTLEDFARAWPQPAS
jgi:hypothetical protein